MSTREGLRASRSSERPSPERLSVTATSRASSIAIAPVGTTRPMVAAPGSVAASGRSARSIATVRDAPSAPPVTMASEPRATIHPVKGRARSGSSCGSRTSRSKAGKSSSATVKSAA